MIEPRPCLPIDQALELPDSLTITTVQPAANWRMLSSTGRLAWPDICTDPAEVCTLGVEAYRWMAKELFSRGRAASVQGLIWGWYRLPGWMSWRFDLPTCPSDEEVVLTLRVPRERVLLSWFEPWEDVLCGGAVASTREAWECDADLPPSQLRATWTRVFHDGEIYEAGYGNRNTLGIQAVLPYLRVSDVVDARVGVKVFHINKNDG